MFCGEVFSKMNFCTDTSMISVVIVNYNAGSHLLECILSVLQQVNHVVVVDNASTDGSIEKCESRFAAEPKLEIVRNQTNFGFSVACNQGYGRTESEFVLFLNPDSRLTEGSLSKLLLVFQKNLQVGMIGGLLVNPDGSEQAGGRRSVPTPWRSFVRAFGLHRLSSRWPRLFEDLALHTQPLPEEPIEVEAISGACTLVSRKAVKNVGLWDEDYFLHCEDLDWCMRFRQKSWKILFVPDALVVHHKGGCSHERPIFVEWHKHKGMVRFYRKYFLHQYPGVLMWMVVLGVSVRFLAVSGTHILSKIRS